MIASKISNRKLQTLAEGLQFPEGPAFATDGGLWAVEMKAGALIRLKNGEVSRFDVGGIPNGIAIDEKDNIIFCDSGQQSIRSFSPHTGQLFTIATHVIKERLSKPNDLVFDKIGNLVFTCPGDSRQEPTGYACVLMKNGVIKKITNQKYFPNGLAFTGDGQYLVIAETYKHRLWKGKWNATTGEWTNEKIWCETGGPVGPGGPDGMAFDRDGHLFVAVYGTGKLKIINPEGEIIDELLLPGQNPTNCAFDPAFEKRLIVTEAEQGAILCVDLLEHY